MRMHNPPHPGLTLRDDVLPALGIDVTEAANNWTWRGLDHIDAERRQHVVAQGQTGMGRVMHTHDVSSMVVRVIHSDRARSFELESDSPISVHLHRPMARHVTLERMHWPVVNQVCGPHSRLRGAAPQISCRACEFLLGVLATALPGRKSARHPQHRAGGS